MISIITPTYNRADYLTRLKDSLLYQTCGEFEWILVDDGSSDGTSQTIKEWGDIPFKFIYLYKENGGKHTAINYGMEYVRGKFVFIVDSDDYLVRNAIEKVVAWTKKVEKNEKVAAVSGLRGYSESEIIGEYPRTESEFVECTNLERRKRGLLGDKAEIYKTEILKKYPFPVFEGEKFLTESAVWNAIAKDGYVIRWYKDIIYIGKYLKGGLTDCGRRLSIDNFQGYTYSVSLNISCMRGKDKYRELLGYISVLKEKEGTAYSIRKYLPQVSMWECILINTLYCIWSLKQLFLRKRK